MALFDPESNCVLCGRELGDGSDRDFFSTTAHFKLYIHPQFHVMNDTVVHQACIDRWELRESFVEFYDREIRSELVIENSRRLAYSRTRIQKLVSYLFSVRKRN